MLVADVFLVSLIDKSGNVIASTTLTEANIEVSVQENDVRGGRGNELLGILRSDRDINISLSDTEFKYDWLATQLGQTITTGAGVAWAAPKLYTATGTAPNIKITLDETPLTTNNDLAIYKLDGTRVTGTLASKDVTFATGVTAGEVLEVRTYKYNTSAQTQTILIDNKVFAKGVRAILETIEIANDETPKFRLQYQFNEALPTGSFSINTSSERNASAQQFNLRVIKPSNSNVVGQILRIPIV